MNYFILIGLDNTEIKKIKPELTISRDVLEEQLGLASIIRESNRNTSLSIITVAICLQIITSVIITTIILGTILYYVIKDDTLVNIILLKFDNTIKKKYKFADKKIHNINILYNAYLYLYGTVQADRMMKQIIDYKLNEQDLEPLKRLNENLSKKIISYFDVHKLNEQICQQKFGIRYDSHNIIKDQQAPFLFDQVCTRIQDKIINILQNKINSNRERGKEHTVYTKDLNDCLDIKNNIEDEYTKLTQAANIEDAMLHINQILKNINYIFDKYYNKINTIKREQHLERGWDVFQPDKYFQINLHNIHSKEFKTIIKDKLSCDNKEWCGKIIQYLYAIDILENLHTSYGNEWNYLTLITDSNISQYDSIVKNKDISLTKLFIKIIIIIIILLILLYYLLFRINNIVIDKITYPLSSILLKRILKLFKYLNPNLKNMNIINNNVDLTTKIYNHFNSALQHNIQAVLYTDNLNFIILYISLSILELFGLLEMQIISQNITQTILNISRNIALILLFSISYSYYSQYSKDISTINSKLLNLNLTTEQTSQLYINQSQTHMKKLIFQILTVIVLFVVIYSVIGFNILLKQGNDLSKCIIHIKCGTYTSFLSLRYIVKNIIDSTGNIPQNKRELHVTRPTFLYSIIGIAIASLLLLPTIIKLIYFNTDNNNFDAKQTEILDILEEYEFYNSENHQELLQPYERICKIFINGANIKYDENNIIYNTNTCLNDGVILIDQSLKNNHFTLINFLFQNLDVPTYNTLSYLIYNPITEKYRILDGSMISAINILNNGCIIMNKQIPIIENSRLSTIVESLFPIQNVNIHLIQFVSNLFHLGSKINWQIHEMNYYELSQEEKERMNITIQLMSLVWNDRISHLFMNISDINLCGKLRAKFNLCKNNPQLCRSFIIDNLLSIAPKLSDYIPQPLDTQLEHTSIDHILNGEKRILLPITTNVISITNLPQEEISTQNITGNLRIENEKITNDNVFNEAVKLISKLPTE